MESCSILSICFSEGRGSVLVTTTLLITEFLKRSMAGPLKHAVGGEGVDLVGAALLELVGGGAEGAAGVDHVVDDHAGAALDLTDDLDRLDGVLHALDAALVHDGEVGVERRSCSARPPSPGRRPGDTTTMSSGRLSRM